MTNHVLKRRRQINRNSRKYIHMKKTRKRVIEEILQSNPDGGVRLVVVQPTTVRRENEERVHS